LRYIKATTPVIGKPPVGQRAQIEMGAMFQVRIHGRGGQGVVTAAELLSVAA
jgi:hypothetical protein